MQRLARTLYKTAVGLGVMKPRKSIYIHDTIHVPLHCRHLIYLHTGVEPTTLERIIRMEGLKLLDRFAFDGFKSLCVLSAHPSSACEPEYVLRWDFGVNIGTGKNFRSRYRWYFLRTY